MTLYEANIIIMLCMGLHFHLYGPISIIIFINDHYYTYALISNRAPFFR